MNKPFKWRTLGIPVYVTIALLVVIVVLFLAELLTFDPRVAANSTAEPLSETSYRERLDVLMADANPTNGDALVVTYGCVACHRYGAENGIAPSFEGVGERAVERRPPLPADAYLYESIVNPSAYLVEGYPDSMPKDFAQRISDADLGDIVAYLLTPNAH